jgi:hypothetical protein
LLHAAENHFRIKAGDQVVFRDKEVPAEFILERLEVSGDVVDGLALHLPFR